jgi:hypothetical protein
VGWRDRFSRDKTGLDATADPEFDYFTAAQGARLRAMVRRAFAEQGVEVTAYAGHVESSDGCEYGLHNVAASCHHAAGREWDDIVRAHVTTVLRASTGPSEFDGLSDAEVLSRTFVRVMGRTTLPDADWRSYAQVLADDLVEIFALDCPETVALFNTDHVQRFGVDALRTAGLANLLAEPIDDFQQLTLDGGASFGVVLGDSVFTASKLLTMTDVLVRTMGDSDAPHGVVACVPNRHQLAFHVVRDSSVVPSLQAMVGFAANGFSDGVGAVSPFAYWWRAGQITQLSFGDDDGRLRVEIGPEFAAVLESVGGDV